MSIKKQYIPAPLASAVKNGYVTDASEILDENKGKKQDEINQETDNEISGIKGGSTKSIADLSEDIANEAERASGVEAGLRESIDELGHIGLDPENAISTDGDDFDGDTIEKRSKIPTIGAIKDGADDEPTVGSNNPVKSGGVADVLGIAFEIESNSAGTVAYKIVAGEKYYIKNLLNTAVTISHRDTPSGTSSDVVNIFGNTEIIYQPTTDGNYIRYGDACHITIEKTNTINYKLSNVIALSKKNSEEIVKNRKDEDNYIIRNFVADGASNFSYNFIEGKEYYLQSNCNNAITISYIKADGTTSVLGNLYPRFVIKFIAIAEAVGIRVGDACDINIIPNIVSNEESKSVEFYDGTIATNLEIGQIIDIETFVTENGHHAVIPVNMFDEVYVNVTGGTAPKTCCFTDKNYVKVSSYDASTQLNGTLICPCDGYCIVNAFGSNYSAIKRYRKSLDLVYSSLYRQVFTSNAPANFQCRFEKGKKYVITCLSTRAYTTFGIKVTQSGTLYNRINIKGFGRQAIIIAETDANYLRAGDPTTCVVEEYDSYNRRVGDIENKIFNYGINSPSVDFDFASTFIDCSADLNGMDFTNSNIMEQIYAKFDALATANPSYITKVDAASANEANLIYPTYANLGGSASGNYLATPTYKTYMYKLIDNSPIANALLPKKKLFIVGATHGDEIAAPFNLYLFAKQLCEGTISDYFKLRAAYDIYILPCLNGYGMYHHQRCNANNVNINRNFPIANWSESGDSTNPQGDYTGATGGSEFETQIVMKLVNKYGFDVLVDHHNYAKLDWQFYCDMSYPRFLPLTYKCLVDCCCAFVKNLPHYFGSKYKLFFNVSNASAPNAMQSVMQGYMSRWGFEAKMPFACTLEICNNINYVNGEYSTNFNDSYGPDTFAVGEYTLRNQICRYSGFLLGNTY